MQRKTYLGQVSAAPITFRWHDANDACSRTPSCPTRPPFRMASAPKARLAGEPTTLRPAGTSPASEPTPSSTAPPARSSGPPHPRPPGRAARPSRHRAAGRSGTRTELPRPRQGVLDRVPAAAALRGHAGRDAADVLPRLRDYCGPIAYQIEHSPRTPAHLAAEAIEPGATREPLHGEERGGS